MIRFMRRLAKGREPLDAAATAFDLGLYDLCLAGDAEWLTRARANAAERPVARPYERWGSFNVSLIGSSDMAIRETLGERQLADLVMRLADLEPVVLATAHLAGGLLNLVVLTQITETPQPWPDHLHIEDWGYLAAGESATPDRLPPHRTRVQPVAPWAIEWRASQAEDAPPWIPAPLAEALADTGCLRVPAPGGVLSGMRARVGTVPDDLMELLAWSNGFSFDGTEVLSAGEVYRLEGAPMEGLVIGLEDGSVFLLDEDTGAVRHALPGEKTADAVAPSLATWLQQLVDRDSEWDRP